MLLDLVDNSGVQALISAEEEAQVKPEELIALLKSWDLYQGQRISEDRVRAWLNQFGEPLNQRLMFQLLQNVTFYSQEQLRSRMKDAHKMVLRDTVTVYNPGQRKRGNVVVSYLDGAAKSGARYAKLYANENEIYTDRVMPPDQVGKFVDRHDDVSAVVVVDDIVGTGQSATGLLKKFLDQSGSILIEKGVKLVFIAVAGYSRSVTKLRETFANGEPQIYVHVFDTLNGSDQCFSEESRIFRDQDGRNRARSLAFEHGLKLEPKTPLGYGDCELAVVFEDTCPNNSLPILWSDRGGWIPLFPRQ